MRTRILDLEKNIPGQNSSSGLNWPIPFGNEEVGRDIKKAVYELIYRLDPI